MLTRQRLGGGSPTPRPAAIRAAGGFVVGLQTSPHIPQGPSGAEGKSRRAAGLGAAGPIHTPGLRRALMLLGAGMGSGAGAAICALLSNPKRRNTRRGEMGAGDGGLGEPPALHGGEGGREAPGAAGGGAGWGRPPAPHSSDSPAL